MEGVVSCGGAKVGERFGICGSGILVIRFVA